MILGRCIWTELVWNLRFSYHVIEADDGPVKGSMEPMVDLGMYEFTDLETGKTKPEESFMNDYTEELYESEHVRNSTKRLSLILDAK